MISARSTVGVKTMHSSDFSDAELLEDDSKSEEWFEELLEDDYLSIPRSFPRCSTSFSMSNRTFFFYIPCRPADNKFYFRAGQKQAKMVLNSVPSAKFPDNCLWEALKSTCTKVSNLKILFPCPSLGKAFPSALVIIGSTLWSVISQLICSHRFLCFQQAIFYLDLGFDHRNYLFVLRWWGCEPW